MEWELWYFLLAGQFGKSAIIEFSGRRNYRYEDS